MEGGAACGVPAPIAANATTASARNKAGISAPRGRRYGSRPCGRRLAAGPRRGARRRARLQIPIQKRFHLSKGVHPACASTEEVYLAGIQLELEGLATCEQIVDELDGLEQRHI